VIQNPTVGFLRSEAMRQSVNLQNVFWTATRTSNRQPAWLPVDGKVVAKSCVPERLAPFLSEDDLFIDFDSDARGVNRMLYLDDVRLWRADCPAVSGHSGIISGGTQVWKRQRHRAAVALDLKRRRLKPELQRYYERFRDRRRSIRLVMSGGRGMTNFSGSPVIGC
jgi:hypothetical protein